jgi:N-acetylglucosaminyl-diphospho-decaprenol L-rhamnosyltransferase
MSTRSADAAVVIVHYRRPDLANACLRSLGAASRGLQLEIVVVDNGSGDGSADELEPQNQNTKIVRLTENRGFAAGVNAGFENSSAPIVILLNQDTEPEPDALTRLVGHLRSNPSTGVAAPTLLHPDGRLQASVHRRFPNLFTTFVTFCSPLAYLFPALGRLRLRGLRALRERQPQSAPEAGSLHEEPVAHVAGAALAIRRAAFEEAGPFDEGFFLYLEETEWQQRVHAAGWAIELVPDAKVVHLIQGGEAEGTPSTWYVQSLYRYMELQGVSDGLLDATLVSASLISCAQYWTVGRLFPARRPAADRLLSTYRGYLGYVLDRRRRRRKSLNLS